MRWACELVLASLNALRGQVRSAAEHLQIAGHQPADFGLPAAEITRAYLGLYSETDVGNRFSEDAPDTTTGSLVAHSIVAAIHGDTATAWRERAAIQTRPGRDVRMYAADIAHLDAWLAAGAGRWEEAVNLLAKVTAQGPMPRLSGRAPIRWLVAESYEHLNDDPEAARYFELTLSPTDLGWEEELFRRGLHCSFAHQRLVLLYSKMGRVEDARRHWEIFEKTFTRPDPELVPMIEEARQALVEAEANL